MDQEHLIHLIVKWFVIFQSYNYYNMNRILLLLFALMVVSNGCNKTTDSDEQSLVECRIYSIDSYTGKIKFFGFDLKQFTVLAFLEQTDDSKSTKEQFDLNCKIADAEQKISSQLADYKKATTLEIMAATAQNGFKLVCDKVFSGVAPGENLSHLFNVYCLTKFSYSDFTLKNKNYEHKHTSALSEYLTSGCVWLQEDWGSFNGLFIESKVSPDPELYEYEETLTFTLTIPFNGLKSSGVEGEKIFEGQFEIWPDMPGESAS